MSTVPDYLKILSCLLNRGASPSGAQILKPETVDLIFQNSVSEEISAHLGDPRPALAPEISYPIVPYRGKNMGWGLSHLLAFDPTPTGRPANTAEWAGVANCFYTIDRTTGIATMIAAQLYPFLDPKVQDLWASVETELYKGLAEES